MENSCLFCRIASGGVPARIAHEDDDTFAFHDIDPRAPVHVLIIPRQHVAKVNDLTAAHAELVGKLYIAAQQIARELGVSDSGYRLVMNNGGDAGQTVDHIHLHLLGGRPLKWPPG